MEKLQTILSKIQNHHNLEIKSSTLNKAIGRGCITIEKSKMSNEQIWVTNREIRRSSRDARDITGEFRGTVDTGITDTFTKDGITTSKNTTWGRILLEKYSGVNFCMGRNGRIDFTIHNSSIYNPNGNVVTDLRVGMDEFHGYKKFKDLNKALQDLQEGEDKLKKAEEKQEKARITAQQMKEEQQRKQKELQEQLQKAKDEAEALRLEELHRKEELDRLEKIREQEELQKRLEEERLECEKHLNGLTEKYEHSVSFIRTQASLRLNPVLDTLQNEIKFSHVYDGVTVVIDGGPGTGKTTTLIQRLKFLISEYDLNDYKLNHSDFKITNEQLAIATDNTANWIFFSPTELLRQYLKENMNYEGLSDTENRTFVYSHYIEKNLRNVYGLFGEGNPFDCRFRLFQNKSLIIGDQLKVVKSFTAFYLRSIKKKIEDAASIEVKGFTWKNIGQIIISTCKQIEDVKDFSGLIRLLFKLNDLIDQPMPEGQMTIKGIVKEYTEKIKYISTSYVSQWRKDEELYSKLLSLVDVKKDTENEEDDDNDSDDDEFVANNLEVKFEQQLRNLLRKLSLKQMGVSMSIKGISANLYSALKDKIDLDGLNKIGELAFFMQKIYNPLMRNPEQVIFRAIPKIYKDYRRSALKSGNIEWNQSLLKDIVDKQKNRLLHPHEQSLLFGFINNLVLAIYKVSGMRFQKLKHKYAQAYKQLCRPVIGVDEATDYCLLDYYAIASLRNYKVSSFALTGDLMQGLKLDGISDWKALKNSLLFPKLEVKALKVSYRQSPELLNLARKIYVHAMKKEPPYKCFLSDLEKTPKPLWFKSDDDYEKAEWITDRILEVQKAYGILPSIAVFVADKNEALALKDSLEDIGRLEDAAIRVHDCSEGDNLSTPDTVRIFPLDLVKGMEFEVVFFHNINKVVTPLIDRYMYVGLSRATFFMGVTSSEGYDSIYEDIVDAFEYNEDWKEIIKD